MDFNWPEPELTVNGNVGIGTHTPSQELDVRGNSIIDGSLTINQNLTVSGNFQLGTLSVNEFSSDENLADNSNLAVPTERAVKTYVDNNLDIKAALNGSADEDFAANNLSVNDSLTVGNAIATQQLSVSGSVTGSLTVDNDLTVGNAIATNQLNVTGSLTVDNDLTVGNAIATNQLNVSGSLSVDNDLIIGGSLSTNGSAQFVTNTGNNPLMISRLSNADNQVVKISVNDSVTTVHYINDENRNRINFRLQNTDTETGEGANANDNVVMTLVGDPSDGRVGIGTTDPSQKLDVSGSVNINEDLNVTGNISGRLAGLGVASASSLTHGQSIPVPEGFTRDECLFFATIKYLNFRFDEDILVNCSADSQGKITATPEGKVAAKGYAIAQKGGWE